MAITVSPIDEDADAFIEYVSTTANGVAKFYSPKSLILIRVDSWFGFQWRGFSGKVLGALGTWRNRNILPPFVPSRIESQRTFASPEYREVSAGNALHKGVPSDVARTRTMEELAPDAALIWYSGLSAKDRRGSVMVYIPDAGEYLKFYIEWKDKNGWILSRLNGISHTELHSILNT